MAIFCNCGSNNWETVVDRRAYTVHAKFSAIGRTASLA